MIRVTAEYTENRNEKIIFDVKLDEKNKPISMLIFGYALEGENSHQTWPFVIEPNNSSASINWGAGVEGERSTINIFEKEITLHNYFTRTDMNDHSHLDEYTYKIVKIDHL
ncbi:hypothetical protein [Hydrogenovibrio marinus]|uniref:Uncharacterized protein n=1 Tax=Hydrogenovibrio marinus TaxID=28885 RepID=A0A067A2I0_HYDMR|nr:hypothetical protein [Hydrogenovibrio marinus]KDN96575.1 hypothetical protein EI16_09985 [Hydrogenovibrio marinus]BBN60217.1 hypothetical protein HVMH_1811 [Hydrogenovibrio marinus]